MPNQKMENLLNLALMTPNEVREKSLNLNVGYEENTRTWEVIVKYNGDIGELEEQGILVEELWAGYAILRIPENLVDAVAALSQIEYMEKPKRLFFATTTGKAASCIPQVTIRAPYLSGAGVLVGVIDSGIDYSNRHFQNADGTSRILYLWDQTVAPNEELNRRPPIGFTLGTEFTKEVIDEALALDNQANRLALVPSVDISGHGTAVAGIAAGSRVEAYEGVAPNSNLLVVKLGVPGADSFPRTTELMRALTYMVRQAQALGRPIAINLSFGNTYGAHNGTSLLERFMDNVSEVGRTVICVGSGNEGASAGHVQGNLAENITNPEGTSNYIELAVSAYEPALSVQLWKNYTDIYEITLRSPGGEEQVLPQLGDESFTLTMEETDILVYFGEPTPYAITQEIYFDFIPRGTFITPGIWTFQIKGLQISTGQYYFYLPSESVRNQNTRFVMPTPQITLTIPSTAQKIITVGAYDSAFDSYADFSGRGYVYLEQSVGLVAAGTTKPDLAAPGVSILAPDTLGGYGSFTGTSFAVPFVTGAVALLMEWGIIMGNDPYLYGEKVKAYLRRGARPIRGENSYPNERVGWGALCLADSLPN